MTISDTVEINILKITKCKLQHWYKGFYTILKQKSWGFQLKKFLIRKSWEKPF